MTQVKSWFGEKCATFANYHEAEHIRPLSSFVSNNKKIRVVGNVMSPNGVALEEGDDVAAVCMKKFNRKIIVAKEAKLVEAHAGVTLKQLLETLDEYNMTIPGVCATTEPTLGGLIQAGCHGSGFDLEFGAPLDQLVKKIKIMDHDGLLDDLSNEDGDKFLSARCGLGSFGVITKVWLSIHEAYYLEEKVVVLSTDALKSGHRRRMGDYRHVRYFYYPYITGKVVAFLYKKISEEEAKESREKENRRRAQAQEVPTKSDVRYAKVELLDILYKEKSGDDDSFDTFLKDNWDESMMELKLRALALKPLNVNHVTRVHEAELDYYKRSELHWKRTGKNWELLAFDPMPPQYVKEVSFLMQDGADFDFADDLKRDIETRGLLPPVIVGQYSAGSSSLISPVYNDNPASLHAWFNIIMYPVGDEEIDKAMREKFEKVYQVMIGLDSGTCPIQEHLGKAELTPDNRRFMIRVHRRNEERRERFHALRREFDPSEKFISPRASSILTRPSPPQ